MPTIRWMGPQAAQELIYNLRLPPFQAQHSHHSHVASVTAKSAKPPAALSALWLYYFSCAVQLKYNPKLAAIHHHPVRITRRQACHVCRGKANSWQQCSSWIFYSSHLFSCFKITNAHQLLSYLKVKESKFSLMVVLLPNAIIIIIIIIITIVRWSILLMRASWLCSAFCAHSLSFWDIHQGNNTCSSDMYVQQWWKH